MNFGKKSTLQLTLTFLAIAVAMVVWQSIFRSHPILKDILWEIHTIFISVILFYSVVAYIVPAKALSFVKILVRVIFKVWIVIFIAFSMQKTFDKTGFVLSATFIFGYFEALLDLDSWIAKHESFLPKTISVNKDKAGRIMQSIFCLSCIHIICAFIALGFFSIS
jgi:hypothetical protein